MTQEAFSDYHLYTMQRKTTINNSQTKQVSLLEGTDVPTTKRYVVEGQNYYYHNHITRARRSRTSVQVYYQFKNEAKSVSASRCRPACCVSISRTRRAARSSWAKTASCTRRRMRR